MWNIDDFSRQLHSFNKKVFYFKFRKSRVNTYLFNSSFHCCNMYEYSQLYDVAVMTSLSMYSKCFDFETANISNGSNLALVF